MEKKLPETLAGLLKPEAVHGRRVRLMFQDEARFGRMVRIRRCWAPTPERPVVSNGYEREFVYVYGGVSPIEGELDWMICRKMNTERMSEYLAHVTAAHPEEFIVMVVDGASSHVAKDLVVPENIRLLRLPSYAPELNPQEHVWDEVREKEFPNRVFADLNSVTSQLESGLPRLAADRERLRSLTAWPWIVSLNLNANWNKTTGNVVWRLGGTAYNKDGAQILTIQGDPEVAFYGVARGVEYALDLDAGTAHVVWQYQGTANSAFLGSFRRYADGTNLIGWGAYTGPANLAFTEVDAAGHDLLDMLFVSQGNWSYRAEKVPIGTFDIDVLRGTAGLP